MPMLGGRYIDPDEYADLRAEAAREAADEELETSGWTCSEPDCGRMWDPGLVRATRSQPAEYRQDSCPYCGGDPVTDDHGYIITGHIDTDEE